MTNEERAAAKEALKNAALATSTILAIVFAYTGVGIALYHLWLSR